MNEEEITPNCYLCKWRGEINEDVSCCLAQGKIETVLVYGNDFCKKLYVKEL